MIVVVLLLVFLGHAAIWVGVYNRIHSLGVRHRTAVVLSVLAIGAAGSLPVALAMAVFSGWIPLRQWRPDNPVWLIANWYAVVCCVAALFVFVRWIWLRFLRPPPGPLRHDCAWPAGLGPGPLSDPGTHFSDEGRRHFLLHIPGNEILRLEVTDRALELPRLVPVLDRLVIVHLSDLHLTGYVGKGFFREMVEVVNKLQPDLVALTGDLVDNEACLRWIPDTLGHLSPRYGSFFVLGNHDLRVDTLAVRRTLCEAGLIDLGGRWMEIHVRGTPVILAGNELPWISPAADLSAAPGRHGDGTPLRIALAHSPDQMRWARKHDVDLLLAGHLHGGQIRLPLVGPIVSPSWHGPHYSTGVFYEPPTVLHVTRGVSARLPVRINCPPEIACLTLHCGRAAPKQVDAG